jgi:outer membrane cobalamin receptor
LKYYIFYIVLFISATAFGQSFPQTDTIKIGDVIINGKTNKPSSGYKVLSMDSSVLMNFNHKSLAQLLSENSTVFIKSYGMGGTATPSFRGTGGSHTQIEWNGININNAMLGQSDLSILPAGLMDGVDLYYGGASMSLNSGGIGGIINLETSPEWKRETRVSLNPGIGSFGQYTGLVSVKTGNTGFQSVTKAFYQYAENDFRYLNNETGEVPVWETRNNSQISQKGFIQELYYRKSGYNLTGRIWYQAADRNLPSSMLTQQVGLSEKQFDESFRSMLNFDLNRNRFNYFFTGAFIINRLNYYNSLVSIDSRNRTDMFTFKTGLESKIVNGTKIGFTLSEDYNLTESNNYNSNKTRNTTAITVSAEHDNSGRLRTSFLVREIIDRNVFLIPDFSAGAVFRISDMANQKLKANISRNSKIPSLNELFWLPGGNPDIKNEYAYIYELTYELEHNFNAPLNIKSDITLFRNSIKDMIQWQPGPYSYWTAGNIASVNTTGIESSVYLDYRLDAISTGLKASYAYTRAVNAGSEKANNNSTGMQLIYVPEHQANMSFSFCYKSIYTSWVTGITGRRYITSDNQKYLPGYCLNGITAGIKIRIENNLLDMNFTADNLFNINYQTIAHYPLPMASYNIKMLFHFVI